MPPTDPPPPGPPPADPPRRALPSGRRGRTRRPPDARSQEIVETALRLFARRGFRGTTVAAVAAEVGITDAGVFHHFPTKQKLLHACLDHHTRQQLELMKDVVQPGGLEALRRLGDWGEVMVSEPHLLGLEVTLSSEAIEPTSRLHEFYSVRYSILRKWLVETIEEGMAAGTIRPDVDPEHEAACYVALLDGLRLQWFLLPDGIDLARHVRTAVDDMVDRIALTPPDRPDEETE